MELTKRFQDHVNIDYQYSSHEKNHKKRLKMIEVIKTKTLPMLASMVPSTQVQVIVLPYQGQVIRSIVACMDFDDANFNDNLKELKEKHPRHKDELERICENINDLKSDGKDMIPSVFVLFSSEDHT